MKNAAILMAAMTLAACDLGQTSIGELPPGPSFNDAPACSDADARSWQLEQAIDDSSRTVAQTVELIGDEMLLGGTPHSGAMMRTNDEGDELWTVELGDAGETFVQQVRARADGSSVVVATVIDLAQPSRRAQHVMSVSSDGNLEWEQSLGTAHYSRWGHGEVRLHPEGGSVISWHSSLDEGAGPQLQLARLDDGGSPLWSTSIAVDPSSEIGPSWSRGAMELLSDGSIVQLTADGLGLRLVRTAADGAPISDAMIEDTEAWPMDLEVVDGEALFVLANDPAGPQLIETSPDGAALARHSFPGAPTDGFLSAMTWHPELARFLLAGTGRDAATELVRSWSVVIERNGDIEQSLLETTRDAGGQAYAVQPAGADEFVLTRHGQALDIAFLTPSCGEI